MTRQCVILVGGLGSRLGSLTAETPKPLLEVGGRPFLDVLVDEAVRFGFDDILLLAGFQSERIQSYIESVSARHGGRVNVHLSVELEPLGTGGAVKFASDKLHEQFLLLNGDSWFDCNLLDLVSSASGNDAVIAVREVGWESRFESLRLDGKGRVVEVIPRGEDQAQRLLINTGLYLFRKEHFEGFGEHFSIESDVLPALVRERKLIARPHAGYFIDIGVPASFERAQVEVLKQLERPALFLDRDGVLNHDHGYVGSVEQVDWIKGAKEAIRLANDRGYFVFVVSNQAGVARGFYDEDAVRQLHRWMQDEFRAAGAHIDDWRYCPYHPEGVVDRYRRPHPWRKPNPGMLIDLMHHWPVRQADSVMIGDQASDLEAARSAGIRPVLFDGGDLYRAVSKELK